MVGRAAVSRKKKGQRWRLPKAFKTSRLKKGFRQRHDGEPRFLNLKKHENDRTLSAHESVKCCDCGLVHLHTYNVLRAPNGQWFLLLRSYRK